jgi:hypothetical protein
MLSDQQKLALIWALFATTLAVAYFVSPIPQDPSYHNFADLRPRFDIPNFGDVVSNIGFLIVGLLGLSMTLGPKRYELFDRSSDAIPYIITFIAVTFVAFGSSYYHWAPSNETLLWDRLPMTIAFMSLFAAVIADRINRRAGPYILLPVLIAAGVLSVIYWNFTELAGQGDLRPYAIVQFFPIIAILIILWLFPEHRYTDTRSLLSVIACYGTAKLLEAFDKDILELLGGIISGHSLKHIVSAVAVYLLLHMLVMANNRPA